MINKIKKILSLISVVLLGVVGCVIGINYIQNDGNIVDIKEVKIKDITVLKDEGNTTYIYPTYVYPGEEFSLRITYLGKEDDSETRLRVTLPGYDYNLIEGNTDTFEVLNGKWDTITAKIKLPKDIEAGEYPLKIEFLGKENSDYIEIPLDVEARPKSLLDVGIDVLPPAVKVGSNSDGKIKIIVRIENRGKEKLKHVNVVAYLKEYPVLTKTVVYLYHNTDDAFNGILEPGSVATLEGVINLNEVLPVLPPSGTYHVVVEVRYDYNHKSLEKETPIEIINVNELKNKENENKEKIAVSPNVEIEVSNPLVEITKENQIANIGITVKNKENMRTEVQLKLEGEGVNAKLQPSKLSIEALGEGKATLTVEGVNNGVYPIVVKVLNEKGEEIGSKTIIVEVNKRDMITTLLYGTLGIILALIIATLIALIIKGKRKKENGREIMTKNEEKKTDIKVEEEELY